MNRRVSEIYEDYSLRVKLYSIDEYLLDFGGFRDRGAQAKALVADVKRSVGIPVRVGTGPSKTLAKCATEIAKKNSIFHSACYLSDETMQTWLMPRVDVSDIWGVRRATTRNLAKKVFLHLYYTPPISGDGGHVYDLLRITLGRLRKTIRPK
jgi:DNA polymerase V